MPFGGRYPNALALLERLKARPSVARVLAEAEPYFQYFPTGMTRLFAARRRADRRRARTGSSGWPARACREVLLVRRADGRLSVAKQGPAIATEAAMLRALAGGGRAGAGGRGRA